MTFFVVADVLLAAHVVSVVALVLAGLLAAPVRRGRRPLARATASVIALAVAGGTALAARGIDRASVVGPGAGGLLGLGEAAAGLLVVVVAALGGGPITELVLERSGRRRTTPDATLAEAIARAGEVLRGGATIGVLERVATALSLLTGFPEGLAVVVAVKALGRYPELRSPGVSERFIIGTLTSLLWAAACAGVGALLLGGPPDLLQAR